MILDDERIFLHLFTPSLGGEYRRILTISRFPYLSYLFRAVEWRMEFLRIELECKESTAGFNNEQKVHPMKSYVTRYPPSAIGDMATA